MGEFRPYESFGSDFIQDFFRNARFDCKFCQQRCQLLDAKLIAEEDKVFALGLCSHCRKEQKFDVTNEWREE